MEQLDIKSLYEEELKEKMISLGEKPFKGKQLYQWLHQKAAGSYEKMTNLSEGLRKKADRTGATDTSGSCRSSDFKD